MIGSDTSEYILGSIDGTASLNASGFNSNSVEISLRYLRLAYGYSNRWPWQKTMTTSEKRVYAKNSEIA